MLGLSMFALFLIKFAVCLAYNDPRLGEVIKGFSLIKELPFQLLLTSSGWTALMGL